jgi:molecular chaperone GrpE (heat shock protein)
MRRWFRSQADPKQLFPIDHLPVEVYGEEPEDALHLLYRRRKSLDPLHKTRLLRRRINPDREKERFFKRILPILDGFDNIFRYAQQNQEQQDETLMNWLKTLEGLYRRLLSALEKEGLVAVESVGNPLDLSRHEVVEVRLVPDVPDNLIVEELVKGYQFGNKLIRDAKVVVAKRKIPENLG